MKHISLFVISVVFSNIALAYNACPEIQPEVMVRFIENDPRIITDKSSKDLIKEEDKIYSNRHTLGRYEPNFKTEEKLNTVYRQSSGGVCAKIFQYNLDITINPVIYLTKEINVSDCQKDRVLKHEMMHHGFSKQVGYKATVFANDYIKKNMLSESLGYSKEEADNGIAKKKNDFKQALSNYIKTNGEILNKQIDNDENYKNEAKLCPPLDRYRLQKELMNKP